MTGSIESSGLTPGDEKDAEIRRLQKVVRVLMDRAERSTNLQGSDFSLFQMTLMLEKQVNERTAQLRSALVENEKVTRALTQTAQRLQASEEELRRHRDHLAELVTAQTADLIVAKDAAERAHALQREFLLNMSHELRTPLHAISSYSALGVERAGKIPVEKAVSYFQRIQESGIRLGSMVDELLDLSVLDTGKLNLLARPTDLRALVEAVEGELRPLAEAHQVRIVCDFESCEHAGTVDPDLLRKAIRHLLGNAIKFSPKEGTVEIALRQAEPAGAGLRELTFRDQGPGIPDGEEESIFEKFTQSSATKTGAGGAGAGLAIARAIIRLHGGDIRVCNRATGGAEFVITLPLNGG